MEAKFHVEVYNLADKYDIVGLQELAFERFKAVTSSQTKVRNMVTVVAYVYGRGPTKSAMRDFACGLLAKHAMELLVTNDKTSEVFATATSKLPELAVDVARCLARQVKPFPALTEYKCTRPTCKLTYEVNPTKRKSITSWCPYCGFTSTR